MNIAPSNSSSARFPPAAWRVSVLSRLFSARGAPLARWAGCVGLIAVLAAAPVSAQRRQGGPREGQRGRGNLVVRPSGASTASPGFAMIHVSPPIQNLFQRAEEGAARADWKFAIDSLQRIIDDPEGSLVRRDDAIGAQGIVYESARRRAMRMLAGLPREGIQAYRLLYDGKAKGLFDRAEATRDKAALEAIVEKYFLTRFGDDAADLLASWALDEGKPAEAVRLLEQVRSVLVDRDVPEGRLVAKLAAAYAMLGRIDEAQALVSGWREQSPEAPPSWLGRVVEAGGRAGELRGEGAIRSSWPMAGGNSARTGFMAEVKPTLSSTAPWSFLRGDLQTELWSSSGGGESEGAFILPGMEMVGVGERVFARTPRGCLAVDANDLSLLWEVSTEIEGLSKGIRLPRIQRFVWGSRSDENMTPAANDELAGAVAVAGEVLLTVERSGASDTTGEYETLRLLGRWGFNVSGVGTERGNRLVARNVRNGEVRWSQGRSRTTDDPLGSVWFRSVPLPVGDELWVPYLNQNDLYVAVLGAAEGDLRQNILLLTADAPNAGLERTLSPAYAEGTVFVPSGHGVLSAIDAGDYTPRWASVYATGAAADLSGHSAPASPWLSSPPIVTRGLVLLAPSDHDELLAFDTGTGAIRWRAPAAGSTYLIGADQESLWLGGQGITCRSIHDGKLMWQARPESAPTGRAVLCGTSVYMPTGAGLAGYAQSDGTAVDIEASSVPFPSLGRLLCHQDALYSLDAAGIRKFPDMERLYPESVARHEEEGFHPRHALLLARLELLRGDAPRALELAAAANEIADPDDAAIRGQAAAIQVDALLTLAERPQLDFSATVELLRESARVAVTAQDRLRSGLAVADYLREGRHAVEAAKALCTLGVQPEADVALAIDDAVEGASRLVVRRRLDEWLSELDGSARRGVDSFLADEVSAALALVDDPATAKVGARRLVAVAELGVSPSAHQALAGLARYEGALGRYEAAEQHLRRRLRLPGGESAALEAQMELCRLYAGLGETARGLLNDEIAAMLRAGSDRPVPVVYAATGAGKGSEVTSSVGAWAAQLVADLGEDQSVIDETAAAPTKTVLQGTVAWSLQPPPRDSTVGFFGSRTTNVTPELLRADDVVSGLRDRVLFFDVEDRAVFAVGARDRYPLWHAHLQLPESFVSDLQEQVGGGVSTGVEVAVDGQTAVFSTEEGLFAVGMVTGKRLWVRPFDGSWLPQGGQAAAWPVAARHGLVAGVLRPGRLALMRAGDGSTLWERHLRGEALSSVRLEGDLVITLDERAQGVNVLDVLDGRQLVRWNFRQPDAQGSSVAVLVADGLLVGPTREGPNDGVEAVDLSTGALVWRILLDRPLAALFEPAAGYVGIGLFGGEMRMVNLRTGEEIWQRRVARAHSIVGAVLRDGLMVTLHYAVRHTQQTPELTAIDVATGEVLWTREDLRLLDDLPQGEAGAAGEEWISAVVEYSDDGGGRSRRLGVALVNLRSGANVGPVVDVPSIDARLRLDGDIMRVAEAVVLRLPAATHSFPLLTVANAEGLPSP